MVVHLPYNTGRERVCEYVFVCVCVLVRWEHLSSNLDLHDGTPFGRNFASFRPTRDTLWDPVQKRKSLLSYRISNNNKNFQDCADTLLIFCISWTFLKIFFISDISITSFPSRLSPNSPCTPLFFFRFYKFLRNTNAVSQNREWRNTIDIILWKQQSPAILEQNDNEKKTTDHVPLWIQMQNNSVNSWKLNKWYFKKHYRS